MKNYLFGFFLLIVTISLQGDEPYPIEEEGEEKEETQAVASPHPNNRTYALRRYETEGEVRSSDTSWAGKREDDFYDSLTH